MRSREVSGERCRVPVKNAIPVKSTVLVKTLLLPGTSAPPNVGSRKYFCASSQLRISRVSGCREQFRCDPDCCGVCCRFNVCEFADRGVPPRSHGIWLGAGGPPTIYAGMGSGGDFSSPGEVRFAYNRFINEYFPLFVSLRKSLLSKRKTRSEI